MAEYLTSSQYHYAVEEPLVSFESFEFREKLVFQIREFWVWSCRFSTDRVYDIIIGSGQTPFENETGRETWMHAVEYAKRYSARQIIIDEYPEHAHELGKAN